MILLFLINKNHTKAYDDILKSNQRLSEDFHDGELPKRRDNIHAINNINAAMELKEANDQTKRELNEAKSKIEQLEKKIAILEGRIPQKYPDVKYLGYKDRKRILVSTNYMVFCFSVLKPMTNCH